MIEKFFYNVFEKHVIEKLTDRKNELYYLNVLFKEVENKN